MDKAYVRDRCDTGDDSLDDLLYCLGLSGLEDIPDEVAVRIIDVFNGDFEDTLIRFGAHEFSERLKISTEESKMYLDKMWEDEKRASLARWKSLVDEFGQGVHKTFVYVVELVGVEKIKIGFTRNPKQRFSALGTGSPYPIRPLLVLRAGSEYEKALHARFSESWITLEWFNFSVEIRRFIEKNQYRNVMSELGVK